MMIIINIIIITLLLIIITKTTTMMKLSKYVAMQCGALYVFCTILYLLFGNIVEISYNNVFKLTNQQISLIRFCPVVFLFCLMLFTILQTFSIIFQMLGEDHFNFRISGNLILEHCWSQQRLWVVWHGFHRPKCKLTMVKFFTTFRTTNNLALSPFNCTYSHGFYARALVEMRHLCYVYLYVFSQLAATCLNKYFEFWIWTLNLNFEFWMCYFCL